jgi:acyl-CoA thioesterase-1
MYSYLALGDSYTIGEGLSPEENFSYQIVRKLREGGYKIMNPHIIAKT